MHNILERRNYALLIVSCKLEKLGSYQSGQLGLTVTQLSFDFGGSNPSLPTKQFIIHNSQLIMHYELNLRK